MLIYDLPMSGMRMRLKARYGSRLWEVDGMGDTE